MSERNLQIKSRFGDYQVRFLENLFDCLAAAKGDDKTFFMVDEKVYGLYEADFARAGVKPVLWKATEESKTYQALEGAFDLLMNAGFKKNSRLVVVGGGILQDAGGFVASTLYRGVAWDLIPTTLLAQADSCIGAKTSVNLTRAKNLLGTFYPPKTVYLTPHVLKTLAPGDIRSGLCEAIKLAMIDGAEHVSWMAPRLAAGLELQGLDELLHHALEIKKRYIEQDELDKGIRNLLNYGHTFAHAFESVTNYAVPHGVAVGIGMQAAVYFSMRLGFVSETHFAEVREILHPLIKDSLPLVKDLSAGALVKVMMSDKKNTSSDITFILTDGYGKMRKHPLAAEAALEYLRDFESLLQ